MLIASRLSPQRTGTTWFSSGRAAFAFLLNHVVKATTVYLPTFVCWSLIDVMHRRFPHIALKYYPVTRDLQCHYPDTVDDRTIVVGIHYFGRRNTMFTGADGIVLEDQSHLPWRYLQSTTGSRHFVFGSLRKSYRIADGGFVEGFYNPVYDPSRKLDTWLRHEARDWRDLREAENMTDRNWSLADISGQSLSVILQTDVSEMIRQRQRNDRYLQANLRAGMSLIRFRDNECPLLHNRILGTAEERDSLRSFLADRQIFTSIHWPVHQSLLEQQDDVDCEAAVWLERHILSIPIAEYYVDADMERICDAANAWYSAGAARFPVQRRA